MYFICEILCTLRPLLLKTTVGIPYVRDIIHTITQIAMLNSGICMRYISLSSSFYVFFCSVVRTHPSMVAKTAYFPGVFYNQTNGFLIKLTEFADPLFHITHRKPVNLLFFKEFCFFQLLFVSF